MGGKEKGVLFRQCRDSFPLDVELGRKTPRWAMRRRGGNGGISFIPLCEESYTVRGDNLRILYKGRKKSHRFTILGDTAFEYDCILEREPESNIVTLAMVGAEHYDFFRQPDFVREDLLKGSYAVYEKQTISGGGTGKLCHIHRPEIIDANGRKCWGGLTVSGNNLNITIPENWLSNAKYPVVVDPIIGNSILGSQTDWYDPDNEEYDCLYIDTSITVNRFMLTEKLNSRALAYVYAYNTDYEGPTYAMLFSDNNNVPDKRLSIHEYPIDLEVKENKKGGWRLADLTSKTPLDSGTNIWFGLSCVFFRPRFDYGAKCYRDYWDYGKEAKQIPDTYPLYSANHYYDFKLSMFFSYITPQAHKRTLTQGVRFNDRAGRLGCFFRRSADKAKAADKTKRSAGIIRKTLQNVFSRDTTERSAGITRIIAHHVKVSDTAKRIAEIIRKTALKVSGRDTVKRIASLTRKTMQHVLCRDKVGKTITIRRIIAGLVKPKFLLKKPAEYRRTCADVGQSKTQTRGGFFITARIFCTKVIHSLTVGRFIKTPKDLIIKSRITREITFESGIASENRRSE